MYRWCKQAIIEWLQRVISIVACCHSVKLCALAVLDFRSNSTIMIVQSKLLIGLRIELVVPTAHVDNDLFHFKFLLVAYCHCVFIKSAYQFIKNVHLFFKVEIYSCIIANNHFTLIQYITHLKTLTPIFQNYLLSLKFDYGIWLVVFKLGIVSYEDLALHRKLKYSSWWKKHFFTLSPQQNKGIAFFRKNLSWGHAVSLCMCGSLVCLTQTTWRMSANSFTECENLGCCCCCQRCWKSSYICKESWNIHSLWEIWTDSKWS